jgi:hypothetical protein
LARRATQSAIYILFLKAGIACRPTKKLFARAVEPGYLALFLTVGFALHQLVAPFLPETNGRPLPGAV